MTLCFVAGLVLIIVVSTSTRLSTIGAITPYMTSPTQGTMPSIKFPSSSSLSFPLKTLKTPPVIKIVYALSQNNPGQLREFAVSLKSLLLHPPREHSTEIYVLYDELAKGALFSFFAETFDTSFSFSGTDSDIDIHLTYISEEKSGEWERILYSMVTPFKLAERHTFGTFWR